MSTTVTMRPYYTFSFSGIQDANFLQELLSWLHDFLDYRNSGCFFYIGFITCTRVLDLNITPGWTDIRIRAFQAIYIQLYEIQKTFNYSDWIFIIVVSWSDLDQVLSLTPEMYLAVYDLEKKSFLMLMEIKIWGLRNVIFIL